LYSPCKIKTRFLNISIFTAKSQAKNHALLHLFTSFIQIPRKKSILNRKKPVVILKTKTTIIRKENKTSVTHKNYVTKHKKHITLTNCDIFNHKMSNKLE